MGLLTGYTGLVFGVANDRSLAWHIASHLIQHGAMCGFSCLPGEKAERRVRKTLETGGLCEPWIHPCDVSSDKDIDGLFTAVRKTFGAIDFVVHSMAFADRRYLRPGRFTETPREVFAQAMDISAYSLISIAHHARAIMPGGGSIIALSYYGSEKVIPGYNVMGVAKAALECSVRYLAAELGADGIRVNAISAGAVRTLSAMAVGDIDELFGWIERKAPLRRNIQAEEVGRAAVYLASDLSSAVTGETIHVDAGYSTIGV